MNIPNRLTLLRILLAFICMGLIAQNTLPSLISAFLVFIFASFTDFLDGFLARKNKLVTDLGKLLDPIADKILIVAVFLALLQIGIISAWMVGAIILREFIITGLRIYSLNKGAVLEAKRFGKHKTLSQIIGIVIILIILILQEIFANDFVFFLYDSVIPFAMWYIVIITLSSGIYYLWVNRKTIKTF